ncbi:DUF418 domain-containing protein [Nocardia sp. NPDC058176]|uniref:DUF418 domain-containing protein n=1 Tax=Nocardia sp. NPDC058176 TaxID=3346368 RepID=UPI0036D90BCE
MLGADRAQGVRPLSQSIAVFLGRIDPRRGTEGQEPTWRYNANSPRTAWIRSVLAPAGRIALTNYLGQSAIGLLIFTGIGLGAAGSLSPLETMTLTGRLISPIRTIADSLSLCSAM